MFGQAAFSQAIAVGGDEDHRGMLDNGLRLTAFCSDTKVVDLGASHGMIGQDLIPQLYVPDVVFCPLALLTCVLRRLRQQSWTSVQS
jgi:hypothetical protein